MTLQREKEEIMKLITLTCPKCGAQMEVNPELEAIICNYCGNKMLIDREVVEKKLLVALNLDINRNKED